MPRSDPLILATLAGLVLAGAVVSIHPEEELDPANASAQAGRVVRIDLLVLDVTVAPAYTRGTGTTGDPAPGGHARPQNVIEWIWFGAPESPPHAGDRLLGRALVEARPGGSVGLVIDGSVGAHVVAGPHPVAVRWDELLDAPHRYAERPLILTGQLQPSVLHAPEGDRTCALAEPVRTDSMPGHAMRHQVRLVRDPAQPGYLCRWEGPAP